MLSNSSAWAISASSFALSLVLFNPLTFFVTDKIAMGKNYIASDNGHRPTALGIFVHGIVLFFAMYCILLIDFACK